MKGRLEHSLQIENNIKEILVTQTSHRKNGLAP